MKLFIFFLFCLCAYTSAGAKDVPQFAVAANMMHVMTDIREQYRNEHGNSDINLVFGSSGNFSRQILQGAPFELFLSANKKYVDFLIHNGVKPADYREFALGRIGYFIPDGSILSGDNSLEDINNSLVNGDFRRIAIANPEYAPYGVAARQALQTAGLWVIEKDKFLLGENIAQAVQFTLSGNVDIGIIPLSYALLPETRDKGKFYLIPENWHEPIIEYLVLLQKAGPAGKAFYQYLLSGRATPILKKYGYVTTTTISN